MDTFDTFPNSNPTPNDLTINEVGVLNSRLSEVTSHEEVLKSRLEKAQERLGSIAIAETLRNNRVLSTIDLGDERESTYPYRDMLSESRIPETIISAKVVAPIIDNHSIKLMDKVSSDWGEQDHSETNDTQSLGTVSNFIERKADISASKRTRKHALRQAEARRAEVIFGAGQGLGVTAKARTAIERHRISSKNEGQFKESKITGNELLDLQDKAKNERVKVPVRAVRREVRRERLGHLFGMVRADQPVRKRVRGLRKSLISRSIVRNEARLNQTLSNKTHIEEEIRRLEEPEDE